MSLFNTGIRPAVDAHLLKLAEEERDYGEYWSASSAGYCMRKNIFERLKVPHATPDDPRKQRVFTAGDIFHEYMQRITKEAGLSIAQELELQDEELMIRGHIDDLVLINTVDKSESPNTKGWSYSTEELTFINNKTGERRADLRQGTDSLILYDYKSQNSRAFTFQKGKPMSYYHRLQLGTYMYMLRNNASIATDILKKAKLWGQEPGVESLINLEKDLIEGRILKISKDDLRMEEQQLMWTPELKDDVISYWRTLNRHWEEKQIPPCTCADQENGFLASEKYNPYFYDGEPCSIKLYERFKKNVV